MHVFGGRSKTAEFLIYKQTRMCYNRILHDKRIKERYMKAIVTVLGKDRVGIIAAVCTRLAADNVNILDISQTILQGNFTMVMAVELPAQGKSFVALGDGLEQLGQEMGLSIRMQRQDIFDAMYTL